MSLEMPASLVPPMSMEGPLVVPGMSQAPIFPGQPPVGVQAPVQAPVQAQVQVQAPVQVQQMIDPVAQVVPQQAVQAVQPPQEMMVAQVVPQQEVFVQTPAPLAQTFEDNVVGVAEMATAQVYIQQEAVPQHITVQAVVSTPDIGNINGMGMDLNAVIAPEDEVKLKEQEKVVTPISIGGLQSIGSCKIANWGGVMKVLEFVSKDLSKEEIIIIDNGTLDTNRDGSFIHCDLKNILGDISLNITSPAVSTKMLKTIRGGDLIQIFKEEGTNSYVFCNIENGKILTRVKTRFAAAEADNFSKAPALPAPTYQKEISANDKEVLKTIISGKSAIENDEPYRFGFSKIDNTLVSVGVGKDFTHFFQDSSIPTDEYKVFYPFPVSNMDSCIIKLYMTQDKGIWLQTISNVDFASIICTEKIEVIDSSVEDFAF